MYSCNEAIHLSSIQATGAQEDHVDPASSPPLQQQQPVSDVTSAAGNTETDVTTGPNQGGEAKMDEADGVTAAEAATKIQASYRGFKARKEIKAANEAASKIQAGFRGYQVRKELKDKSEQDTLPSMSSNEGEMSTNDIAVSDLEQQSAVKIQAGVRGYLERKKLQTERDAAVKIQAGFRGYKARREVKEMLQDQNK
ncbi:hypothetical protein C0J52_08423 [Blattella germanica]|nr:hypothetical protein C0J52_08423 [Blattella germanica]